MPLDTMQAKIAIARALQEQSSQVWTYRVIHFASLSPTQRLELKEASRKLNQRADEVLEDALEEGTSDAERLLDRLGGHTKALEHAQNNLAAINSVLASASKISKAAAGVISGGITNALALL
jgi:hypothetical protein